MSMNSVINRGACESVDVQILATLSIKTDYRYKVISDTQNFPVTITRQILFSVL